MIISIKIYIINSIIIVMSNIIFFISCIVAKRNENFIFPCISIPFTLFWIPEYIQVRFHISKIGMRSSIVRFNKSCIYSVWHAGNVHYGFQFEIPIYERRTNDQKAKKESKHKKEEGREEKKNNGKKKWKKKCQFDSNLCT